MWRLSCHRPFTSAFLRTLIHAVLKDVIGRVGSLGSGVPKGNTNHSGLHSQNRVMYQEACSVSAAMAVSLSGITRPVPASVFDLPTVSAFFCTKSICSQRISRSSLSRRPVFKSSARAACIIWPIERLIPRATNPRTHRKEQIASIAASIREWGWTNPILVGAENDIIAGHARLAAAQKLGMTEVPVIVLAHLSPAQRRALVIADNQLAVMGAGWDEELLRIELATLQEEDYNLDLVGFDDIELQ